jgi:hypothetical protein
MTETDRKSAARVPAAFMFRLVRGPGSGARGLFPIRLICVRLVATLPALVVHGRADPFFPVGNGEALADAIPAARLLVLDDMGTALRDAAAGEDAPPGRPRRPARHGQRPPPASGPWQSPGFGSPTCRLRQLALERSHHARSDRLCPAAGGLRQIRQGHEPWVVVPESRIPAGP